MKYRYYVCGFLFSALFLASGCGNLASNVVTEEQESQAETIQESTPAEITEVSEPSATEAITTEMILETEEESPTQQDSEEDVVWIEELNEIKYATDNVNIRSQATKDSDRLGSFGWGDEVEVTGRTTDGKWYRIRLSDTEGFVSAIYLSDIKPEREQATASEADEEEIEIREETETEEEVETEEEESATEEAETEEETEISPVPEHSFAGQLSISEGLEQLVIVEAKTNDSRAVVVTMHERQNGIWTEILRTDGYVGYSGIAKEQEGDGRTPTGVYGLSVAFGTKSDPGSILPYTQVDESYWWVGDYESIYFNQLCREDVPDRDWELDREESEHLVDYNGYEYCLFIEYNTGGSVGKGSCIFLHCIGKNPYTLGCVAVPEEDMVFMLRHIRGGCRILIDTTENLPGY